MTTERPDRPIVDVEAPETWPAPLAALVADIATTAPSNNPEAYVDLRIDDREDEARQLLAGHLVRARHCTRLLAHEADAIRAEGLRLLTPELLTHRLDQAHQLGLLTAAERTTLSAGNRLAVGHQWAQPKPGIFFFLTTFVLRERLYNIWPLLSTWGGEAIYGNFNNAEPANKALAARLRCLGRPAIVTTLLDLSDPRLHRISRSLVHAFVGCQLGAEEADAVVHYLTAVPPQQVESVALPGDAAYDQFPRLPRS